MALAPLILAPNIILRRAILKNKSYLRKQIFREKTIRLLRYEMKFVFINHFVVKITQITSFYMGMFLKNVIKLEEFHD
uniref:Uncharacterized protein n=1 Tax=Onchocerca volvulus TaxID=6282 RepID=A0A8R1XQY1_ONCVO